ncbi:MAG: phosphoribosyltransferase family protein [bacterium]
MFKSGNNKVRINPLNWMANTINDFLAPPHCEICKTLTYPENNRFEFICQKCYDSIPLAPEPDVIFNRLIQGFDKDDLFISGAVSLFSIKEDHDYMNAIYSMKYFGFSRIGTELGKELGRLLKYQGKTNFDALVPVPIHHARRRERGYNQSEFIAKGVSNITGIPVNTKIIKRKKYTQTQTVLSKTERRNNIRNAITAYRKETKLDGGSYLLIDDVLTTGSTLNVCAEVLLFIGAKNVEVATLVYA